MQTGDATIDIPLSEMQSGDLRQNSSTPFASDGADAPVTKETTAEHERRRMFGGRRVKRLAAHKGSTGAIGYDGEPDRVNKMGRIYNKITSFSTLTRYMVYVTPLALCIAVPIIVGATAAQSAEIGGVRIVWFFSWIEIGG